MKKRLGTMAGVLLLVLVMGMTVWAADAGVIDVDIKKNQVFQVNSDVELHEQPDAASAVTATLPGGTPVIAKEDAKDGWCLVAYQRQWRISRKQRRMKRHQTKLRQWRISQAKRHPDLQ